MHSAVIYLVQIIEFSGFPLVRGKSTNWDLFEVFYLSKNIAWKFYLSNVKVLEKYT